MIQVSDQVRKLLQLETNELNGDQLIHAILKMHVDLLWFGGIGTYIKADHQSHFVVGDIGNDAVRINDSECQATVVGEGANLS